MHARLLPRLFSGVVLSLGGLIVKKDFRHCGNASHGRPGVSEKPSSNCGQIVLKASARSPSPESQQPISFRAATRIWTCGSSVHPAFFSSKLK